MDKEKPLSINIFTKGDKVHFVIDGFNTPEEAINWATIQHCNYLLAEKDISTVH